MNLLCNNKNLVYKYQGRSIKGYISAIKKSVDPNEVVLEVQHKEKVFVINYIVGSNRKVDIAIQQWIKHREKSKMFVPFGLPKQCYGSNNYKR